jgi:hypothetical protein
MDDSAVDKISIYLSVDRHTLNEYFNAHDPSPIYKRQLSQQLEEYIQTSVANAKRYTAIFYKLKCVNEIDRQFTEPLMYAIRSHYSGKKVRRIKEFRKFKVRSWILLLVSLAVVMVCQGFVPMIIDTENRFVAGLVNSLDIFSWVLLWRPLDVLLFSWNPHLKDICLLNKLATSEVIIIEDEK